MKQLGFLFNAQDCIGCRTCQVACKDTFRLPVGENFRRVSTYCTGSGYTPRIYHISLSCNHCASPICMTVCSSGAISKDTEFGLVTIDSRSCTGCKSCIETCPYKAISFSETKQTAQKCDGCRDIRKQGEDPACVASCPQRVIEFGDIKEIERRHTAENLTQDSATLTSSELTKPSLWILEKDCMQDKDYDEVLL